MLWAANNPEKISYNVQSKEALHQISPNLVGFQSVIAGISVRSLKHKKQLFKITVDQQLQFNKAQNTLAEFYASLALSGETLRSGKDSLLMCRISFPQFVYQPHPPGDDLLPLK